MLKAKRCATTVHLAGVCLIVWLSGGLAVGQEAGAAKGPETVSIVNERISQKPIDLKQGGQFIEPLCNLIPSMLAQQVAGDTFEEEPAYKVAYKRDTDKPFRFSAFHALYRVSTRILVPAMTG